MSKYSDRLFSINTKKGTLELNKEEVRQIPAYKAIIIRDKGGKVKGDPDGRRKYFAFKELYYVYIMADPFNMYSVLNEERRHKRAIQVTSLIDIEGWKPDKAIKDAIKQYIEDIKLSPTAYTYINARKALQNIGKDLELLNTYSEELRDKMREHQETIKNIDSTEKEIQEAELAIGTIRRNLIENSNSILLITKSIPERHKSLEQLKTQLAEEDSELEQVVGGGLVFEMEDPD